MARDERGGLGDDRGVRRATPRGDARQDALEIAPLEEAQSAIVGRDIAIAPRIELGRRGDERERGAELLERTRARAGARRELDARLEHGRAQVRRRAAEPIVEACARDDHRLFDGRAACDALRRGGLVVGARQRGEHEGREHRVARGERAVVRRGARVARDVALDAIERAGGRAAEDARERQLPRAVLAGIVRVAIEPDASEQPRGGHALEGRARDAEIDEREGDELIAASCEGEGGARGRRHAPSV